MFLTPFSRNMPITRFSPGSAVPPAVAAPTPFAPGSGPRRTPRPAPNAAGQPVFNPPVPTPDLQQPGSNRAATGQQPGSIRAASGQHPGSIRAASGQHPGSIRAASGQHPGSIRAASGQHPPAPAAGWCWHRPVLPSLCPCASWSVCLLVRSTQQTCARPGQSR